jgi:hypothetical protein
MYIVIYILCTCRNIYIYMYISREYNIYVKICIFSMYVLIKMYIYPSTYIYTYIYTQTHIIPPQSTSSHLHVPYVKNILNVCSNKNVHISKYIQIYVYIHRQTHKHVLYLHNQLHRICMSYM